jgi:Na+/serine symporter
MHKDNITRLVSGTERKIGDKAESLTLLRKPVGRIAKVAIVGITSWGITIGLVLASKGTKVSILTRTEQESSICKKWTQFRPLPD